MFCILKSPLDLFCGDFLREVLIVLKWVEWSLCCIQYVIRLNGGNEYLEEILMSTSKMPTNTMYLPCDLMYQGSKFSQLLP